MLLRLLVVPAVLLLDPKGCAERRDSRAASSSSEDAADQVIAAPVATDGGAPATDNTIALVIDAGPPHRTAEPPGRAEFFGRVQARWMRNLRRFPELRRDIDAYRHRPIDDPSPPPWPTGLQSEDDAREVSFVTAACNDTMFLVEDYLAGIPWYRNGIDRVCCFNRSPIARRRICFDTSGREPRHVSTEDLGAR